MNSDFPFWSKSTADLFEACQSSPNGLTQDEAARRLDLDKNNLLKLKREWKTTTLFLSQFSNPLILLLLACSIFLGFTHDVVDALIILTIVLISGMLGFWQEYSATRAVDKLLSLVKVNASVLRDGISVEVPLDKVVQGDIVLLSAGDIIPGDGIIIEAKDFFVDEATLTGETFPQEKMAGRLKEDVPLSGRLNTVFMETHVVSGMAKVMIIFTGNQTIFGQTTEKFRIRKPDTDFERGVRRFGYFLLEVTFILVSVIFALNVFFERPFFESLLFSIALAIGLTPQLLPAIISVNLAYGAKNMAKRGVIVKKLNSIENFGSMNILCADKTGTLTQGIMQVDSYVDVEGVKNEKIALFAFLNAYFQTGYHNPIDAAIVGKFPLDPADWKKTGEIPYDFLRKRLSVAVSREGESLLITKGAFAQVLECCSTVEDSSGKTIDLSLLKEKINARFEEYSRRGLRVIAVAYRSLSDLANVAKEEEKGMTFLGFLVLNDPVKEDAVEALCELKEYGVKVKIISGDNRFVAKALAEQVIKNNPNLLLGSELSYLSDHALIHKVQHIDVFAEIEPNQKERLILALQKSGNVVGYIGDGINDVTAMHASDVSISVNKGVDCVKEAADIVLLEKDLSVLLEGLKMGRLTFANTLKYVMMATSANFGNMFSMAGASLFLNFLPLLPKQILLTNLLTDLPEMAIATDSVDAELIRKPQRWNIHFIRKFMLLFGLISTVFDYITFGTLLYVLNATPDMFRTGWFVESVISATMIVLVVRTRLPFFKSFPSKSLLFATIFVVLFVLIMPTTPLMGVFGFVQLPAIFFPVLTLILGGYIFSAELAKKYFYKRISKG